MCIRDSWLAPQSAARAAANGLPEVVELSHGLVATSARPNPLYAIARGWDGATRTIDLGGCYNVSTAAARASFEANPAALRLGVLRERPFLGRAHCPSNPLSMPFARAAHLAVQQQQQGKNGRQGRGHRL